MTIMQKRAVALLIDELIYASIIAAIQLAVPDLLVGKGPLLILLFIPLLFRDILFRNASIGKKIMRIAIFDNSWQPPKPLLLFKRSFLTGTVVYVMLYKYKFVDGCVLPAIDWERDNIGTRVIDLEVYKEIDAEAKRLKGDYAENMTRLYAEYLKGIYLDN